MFGLNADMLKDMTIDQIQETLEKFNINIPEILGHMEAGLLGQAAKIREATGKNMLLVMEPNSTNEQLQVTIYKDMDGFGDLVPFQQFAFRNLLELFKNQPNTNTLPHEEPQIKQIGPGQCGSGTAAGGYDLIKPGTTEPEPDGTTEPEPDGTTEPEPDGTSSPAATGTTD